MLAKLVPLLICTLGYYSFDSGPGKGFPDLKGFVVFLGLSRNSLGIRGFNRSRVGTYGRTDRRGNRRVIEAFFRDLQKRLH